MLSSSGGMERLRAAEKAAKDRRLNLFANAPVSVSAGKSNGNAAANGQSRSFDATVVRVWSGDQVSVVEKDSRKERRLYLSSTRSPKYGSSTMAAVDANLFVQGFQTHVKHFMLRKPENF